MEWERSETRLKFISVTKNAQPSLIYVGEILSSHDVDDSTVKLGEVGDFCIYMLSSVVTKLRSDHRRAVLVLLSLNPGRWTNKRRHDHLDHLDHLHVEADVMIPYSNLTDCGKIRCLFCLSHGSRLHASPLAPTQSNQKWSQWHGSRLVIAGFIKWRM